MHLAGSPLPCKTFILWSDNPLHWLKPSVLFLLWGEQSFQEASPTEYERHSSLCLNSPRPVSCFSLDPNSAVPPALLWAAPLPISPAPRSFPRSGWLRSLRRHTFSHLFCCFLSDLTFQPESVSSPLVFSSNREAFLTNWGKSSKSPRILRSRVSE